MFYFEIHDWPLNSKKKKKTKQNTENIDNTPMVTKGSRYSFEMEFFQQQWVDPISYSIIMNNLSA